MVIGLQRCARCKELLTYDDFYANRNRLDSYCKKCKLAYHKEWSERKYNKQNRKEYRKQWWVENKNRLTPIQKVNSKIRYWEKKKGKLRMDVMTKTHERFEEFCIILEGPENCNFRENENGKIIWNCKGGMDKTFATKILENMGGFDIKRSMEYFEEKGGHCDCEILFNIHCG